MGGGRVRVGGEAGERAGGGGGGGGGCTCAYAVCREPPCVLQSVNMGMATVLQHLKGDMLSPRTQHLCECVHLHVCVCAPYVYRYVLCVCAP